MEFNFNVTSTEWHASSIHSFELVCQWLLLHNLIPRVSRHHSHMICFLCFFCVGKLHHHIVALQVSEGMAIKKLETAQSKVYLISAGLC